MKKKYISKNFLLWIMLSIVLSTAYFFIGFHAFDVGHNLRWVNCEFKTDLYETNALGNFFSPDKAIKMGGSSMFYAFMISQITLIIGVWYLWTKTQG